MMSRKEQVYAICQELSQHGWRELLGELTGGLGAGKPGLDIQQPSADALEDALLREYQIDRRYPGFEDFALEGRQGVAPGKPAHSLLYHALASPNVLWKDRQKSERLTVFPSWEQLDVVEDYVFGIKPPTLAFLKSLFPRQALAVVVFSSQYRIAVDVPHQKHADLVFSRTGVARVGTAEPLYDRQRRSFVPLVEDDPRQIRVLPAKYHAYIAVLRRGSPDLLGETRFRDKSQGPIPTDAELDFWYPLHKLFDGEECIEGHRVSVVYTSEHVNEKIAKIHQFAKAKFKLPTGQPSASMAQYPFRFSEGLATFDSAQHLVIPTVHPALVAAVEVEGRPITFKKPAFGSFFDENQGMRRGLESPHGDTISHIGSSLELRSPRAGREAPEYLHIRQRTSSPARDLNTSSTMMQSITQGAAYNAQHYVDFTADGWVSAQTSLPIGEGKSIPAYSLVAAVDFFPYCEQTELLNEPSLKKAWSTDPLALADTRFLPNFTTHPTLRPAETERWGTGTALIPHTTEPSAQKTDFKDLMEKRVSYLPDGANGVFAPGWDTSFDLAILGQEGVPHLSQYGLGSPFPEDAKLCAALSSFWPAVAPDITRVFWPTDAPTWPRRAITVLPLLDREVGANGHDESWDGEPGPQIQREGHRTSVRFKKLEYVDYTLNSLEGKFQFHLLAAIDAVEYQTRVSRMLVARQRLGDDRFMLVSYTQVGLDDPDVARLVEQRSEALEPTIHKFVFMRQRGNWRPVQGQFQFLDVPIEEERTILVDARSMAFVLEDTPS